MRANGAEPVEVEALPVQEATAVAAGGRGYAFQVKCTPQ